MTPPEFVVDDTHGRDATYEHATTIGPRKAWYDEDVPPPGEGWERDRSRGDYGFERFDHHEESYWRRPLPANDESPAQPEEPTP